MNRIPAYWIENRCYWSLERLHYIMYILAISKSQASIINICGYATVVYSLHMITLHLNPNDFFKGGLANVMKITVPG